MDVNNFFLVILGILFCLSEVCYSANRRVSFGYMETSIGVIGKNITLTASINKKSVDDYLAISYGPPSMTRKILWQENETFPMPDGITVLKTNGPNNMNNPDSLYNWYQMTFDLSVDPTLLKNIAVSYTLYFIADPTVYTSTSLIAVEPPICAIDGDSTTDRLYQFYDQVNATCALHYFGDWSPKPFLRWNVWDEDDLHEPTNQIHAEFTTGENGTYAVTAIESQIPAPLTFYEVPIGRIYTCIYTFNRTSVATPVKFNQSCVINYKVQSCKRSTRCVVNPYMNTAVQPGQTVTLSTTFRKQAVDDWVVITYDPPGAPGTIIWQENDTSIVPPAGMSVKNSFNQTSMRGMYSLTIQMPTMEKPALSLETVNNLTVTYKAFMISHPVVVTKANITVVDLNCALNVSPRQANESSKTTKVIVGERADLNCDVLYTGYKKPTLNWYNQSGSLITKTSTNTSEVMVGGGFWLTANSEDSEKTYQCKIKYVKTKQNLTPVYTQACNVSFTVLYATSCSISGGTEKVPNEAVEMTCTTNYDGVNIPTLDWYNKRDQNVTSYTVTHSDTEQYKAVMSKKAGSVGSGEVLECRLRYQYVQQNNNMVTVEQSCMIQYSVKDPTKISGSMRMTADFVQIVFLSLFTTRMYFM